MTSDFSPNENGVCVNIAKTKYFKKMIFLLINQRERYIVRTELINAVTTLI